MTAQEQQMLQDLTERINQTQLPEKDADAEQYLEQELGQNRDAVYILAQTVLVQQYAIEQAKKQIADARSQIDQLNSQLQQPKHATSFLGSLLGHTDPPPPPPQAQYVPVPNYGPAGYPPPPPPPGYGYGAPVYGAPIGYGAPQQGGFLRSAMQTATGVAAGALAFEGIESLMHGFGHAAGYGYEPGFGGGGFPGGEFGGAAPREEIVNNYYGDASPRSGGEHGDSYPEGKWDDSSRSADAGHGHDGSDVSDASVAAEDRYTGEAGGGSDTGDSYADDSSSFDGGSGDDFGGGGDFGSGGGDDSGGNF
jgi:uncharacterized protein